MQNEPGMLRRPMDLAVCAPQSNSPLTCIKGRVGEGLTEDFLVVRNIQVIAVVIAVEWWTGALTALKASATSRSS